MKGHLHEDETHDEEVPLFVALSRTIRSEIDVEIKSTETEQARKAAEKEAKATQARAMRAAEAKALKTAAAVYKKAEKSGTVTTSSTATTAIVQNGKHAADPMVIKEIKEKKTKVDGEREKGGSKPSFSDLGVQLQHVVAKQAHGQEKIFSLMEKQQIAQGKLQEQAIAQKKRQTDMMSSFMSASGEAAKLRASVLKSTEEDKDFERLEAAQAKRASLSPHDGMYKVYKKRVDALMLCLG